MRLKTKIMASVCTVCALASLACGLACNSHELTPFSSSIKANKTETVTSGSTRQVDILFVVDNSNSMIEEQRQLSENFARFLNELSKSGADFHLAAVTTADSTSDQVKFNNSLGEAHNDTYGSLKPKCEAYFKDHSDRAWLASSDFTKDNELSVEDVQDIFFCMGLTGTGGSAVERGLATSVKALKTRDVATNKGFLRDGALLSIVYITDENDCSSESVARESISREDNAEETDSCELNRNIEDSCVLANKDRINNGNIATYKGPVFVYNGESKQLRSWCVEGNREALEAFYASDPSASDFIKCPDGQCHNGMTKRTELFDDLIKLVGDKNKAFYISQQPTLEEDTQKDAKIRELARQDIIIATVINRDQGRRFDESLSEAWCGSAGTQSYRYQYFAEMFDNPIYSPICCKERVISGDNVTCDADQVSKGDPSNFGPTLAAIGSRIGESINTICMTAKPVTCDPVACKEGDTVACPCVAGCSDEIYMKGTDYEYHVCNEFKVKVGSAPYVQGQPDYDAVVDWKGECSDGSTQCSDLDYLVDMSSNYCINRTGSPILVTLKRSAKADALIIQYPQKVSVEK